MPDRINAWTQHVSAADAAPHSLITDLVTTRTCARTHTVPIVPHPNLNQNEVVIFTLLTSFYFWIITIELVVFEVGIRSGYNPSRLWRAGTCRMSDQLFWVGNLCGRCCKTRLFLWAFKILNICTFLETAAVRICVFYHTHASRGEKHPTDVPHVS